MNLEQMLRAGAAEIDWPQAPDIVAAVKPRIATPRARVRVRVAWRRSLAFALIALLLLAGAAMAVPGIREPVLDWLGLRAVHIERVPRPLPEAPGAHLGLGQRTTLAAARNKLGFSPVVPAGLGNPTVFYEDFPPGGQLALVYRGGGMLLTEVQGSLDRRYLYKFLSAATRVDALQINGQRGLWIDGLHQYVFTDRGGAIRTDSVRTAGSVLLWRRGGLLLRLEGARTRAEALRIASSLRAAP